MYPYDSGAPNYPNPNQPPYPPNNQSPYPPQNQSPYPPSNQAPYPSFGGAGQSAYPGQNQAPALPGFGGGFAAAPQQQQSYPGYPPQQSYPNQPYPSQPVYPPQPGYPSQPQSGFPTPFPPSSTAAHAAYADQAPNPSPYPPQAGYPGGPPSQPQPGGYGQQPSAGYGQPPSSGYPGGPPQSAGYGQQPSAGGYGQPPCPYPGGPQQSAGYGQPPSNMGGGGGYGAISAVNMSSCYSEAKGYGHDAKKEVKGTPTIVPVPNFDPMNDAKTLRKAMKGFGTDEDAIINVLCFRTNEQRQIIQREFKTCYGKDLIEDIKSETSGNFENVLVSMLTPIVEFYVKELHHAMSGVGTDEDVLIEVFCSLSNYEINTIKQAYYSRYMIPLEKALISETSGNFKRLLVSLCAAGRDESGHVDPASAQRDAQELLNAGQLRFGTDESTFNLILCKRNYQQLQMVCEEYQKLSGHSLEKAIKREFSGDIMDGLLAIVRCVTNKFDFFASRLEKSMAGMGTKDNQLMRLIITRSEIDLHDIKMAFERNYGKTLKSWIKSDASGHYKHALLALIGENRS